uniref:Marinolic acid--CoA ligase n=1 Tax=Pseudoalteromonas sp. (strain SANK 73390) TaxID=747457 RepID=TMLU_PSEX7|nr:acyl-CoA synthetase [Pseudoalteromonas sp. SANK 73390]F8J3D9.1 RecName: Full=Marinolic acid--CoA ligase [Pseudoalteromonas sp. SANK 73390]CBK62739.1 tmlU [Pseudoalteromonas sp. SANK 73390]
MNESALNPNYLFHPFVKRFPGDPEHVRNISDIQQLEKYPISERFPCQTVTDALFIAAKKYQHARAMSYLPNGRADDVLQSWSYLEFLEQCIGAANLFHSLGIESDHSVAFLLPNMPEMVFGLWGAQAVAISTPINPFLAVNHICGIVTETKTTILVTLSPDTNPSLFEKALAVKHNTTHTMTLVTIGTPCEDAIDWHTELKKQPFNRYLFNRQLTGMETSAYFHTGGTTGTPKIARHTHRGAMINACQMLIVGPTETELDTKSKVSLCALPLFHVNAIVVSSLTSLLNGSELLLAGQQGFRNKALMSDFWRIVERFKVNFFAGVPTVYAALLEQPVEQHNIDSLFYCGCGSSPMPQVLIKEFTQRTGADICEGYGMTETTACASTHYYYGDRKVGSVGMRVPYQHIRAVHLDDNGQIIKECDCDEVGVLLIQGPNVIPEYKQAFANEQAWPEPGWLNTGDLGKFDADGYLWLTGRQKDLIIRGGHNIDPLIIENTLVSHSDVVMAAAVGKPDAYAGELPVAYVTLTSGATLSADELKQYCKDYISEPAASPVEIYITAELPMTPIGKIFKLPLKHDVIVRFVRELIQALDDTLDFSIDIIDDVSTGNIVSINFAATREKMEAVASQLQQELDKLHFQWKCTFTPVLAEQTVLES